MTISYPLSLPSGFSYKTLRVMAQNVSQVSESPFSLNQTIYDRDGEKWFFEIAYQPLTLEQARAVSAFLLSLNGQVGTFLAGDPLAAIPAGSASGVPLVNGGSQSGHTLVTDGWTPSITNVLRAGDYIQISNRLYMVLTDTNSDGSGNATLDIWPNIRQPAPADNTPITTSNCKGLFRLDTGTVEWVCSYQKVYEISFTAIEAI